MVLQRSSGFSTSPSQECRLRQPELADRPLAQANSQCRNESSENRTSSTFVCRQDQTPSTDTDFFRDVTNIRRIHSDSMPSKTPEKSSTARPRAAALIEATDPAVSVGWSARQPASSPCRETSPQGSQWQQQYPQCTHQKQHHHRCSAGRNSSSSGWYPRDGKSSSRKLPARSALSEVFRRLRAFMPLRRMSTLFRTILTVLLLFLASQQLLLLRSVESQVDDVSTESNVARAGAGVSKTLDEIPEGAHLLESLSGGGEGVLKGTEEAVQGKADSSGRSLQSAGTSDSGHLPDDDPETLQMKTTGAAGAVGADPAAVASAKEWVQEMRLCIMTSRALLQMAEDSGDENMVASARQEMEQCMALLADPAGGGSSSLTNSSSKGYTGEETDEAKGMKDSAGGGFGQTSTNPSLVNPSHGTLVNLTNSEKAELQAVLLKKVKETRSSSHREDLSELRADRIQAMKRLESAFKALIPLPTTDTEGPSGGSSVTLAAAAAAAAAAGLTSKRKALSRDSPGVTRLKRKLEASEQQTRAVLLQSMLYSQLAAKSVPRGLHCLALRLTLAWNSSPDLRRTAELQEKGHATSNGATAEQRLTKDQEWGRRLVDPNLFHYALFSDNVLAVAVVVNSTATHLRDPSKHVIHVVTDRMNLAAIRAWLAISPPAGGAMAYEVLCLEDFAWLNASFVPVLRQQEMENIREFYYRPISAGTHSKGSSAGNTPPSPTGLGGNAVRGNKPSDAGISAILSRPLRPPEPMSGGRAGTEDYLELKYRNPKYLSILNHLRFYMPLVFPNLTKVLFLDDDVVVQRDLSPLWKIPMRGNVNLAVETCGKTFHRFKTYLNFSSPLLSSFDPEGCAWAFGMNLFDLQVWRKSDFTLRYHFWQQQNENRTLWKLGTLPAGLLTFYNSTEILQDRSWHVLGLGSKRVVSLENVRRAGVVHWNGHAKPWLDLANPLYQSVWTRYVPYENEFFRQCNIEPPKPLNRPPHSNFGLLRMLQIPSGTSSTEKT